MLSAALLLTEMSRKAVRFDLGSTDGLRLVAIFNVSTDSSGPVNVLEYQAHFYAKDKAGKIVHQLHKDMGPCFRKPNSFIVADRFGRGSKQVFISLQYGGIGSYLVAFRDRKFYYAFVNNEARVRVRILPSSKGSWKLEESDSVVHAVLDKSAPNSRTENGTIRTTWIILATTDPILKI